jgi:hypothetical protein
MRTSIDYTKDAKMEEGNTVETEVGIRLYMANVLILGQFAGLGTTPALGMT